MQSCGITDKSVPLWPANLLLGNMDVACSTDSNYLKYAITMLLSLFDHHQGEEVRIHLLADGLTDDEVDKVRCVVEGHGAKLMVYAVDGDYLGTLVQGCYGYITPTTYARLFLPDLLPQEVKRVIYLDCDLLVLDSLLPLWEYPLKETHEVGAVEDSCCANPTYYSRLHLSPEEHRYFNAGVLLINLEAWRKGEFVKRAVELLHNNSLPLDYADQDVLNVLCVGRTTYLPFRYNLQEAMLRRYVPEISDESRRLIVESLPCPAIIHFTYLLKPWNYVSFHPYRRHFYHYFDQTDWKGERPSPTFKQRLWRLMWRIGAAIGKVNTYWPLPEHLRM